MKIFVHDSQNSFISTNDIQSLSILYSQCFNVCITKHHFNHLDNEPYMLYFLLKDDNNNNNNNELIAFCKIIFLQTSYELYDVCRKNPHIPLKNVMKQFIKQCIFYIIRNYLTLPIFLGIKYDNPYKEQAYKLYTKLNFSKTKQKLKYQKTNDKDCIMIYACNSDSNDTGR